MTFFGEIAGADYRMVRQYGLPTPMTPLADSWSLKGERTAIRSEI